jgi:8-oxo-dGTP diphosphatase
VPVFLIRHAQAGRRSSWQGVDRARPLSRRGKEEAKRIAKVVGGRRVRRVLSSPAVRCVQTVTPLAADAGVDVEVDKRLREGGTVKGAMELMLKAPDGTALCAHGDLIPAVMQRLADDGMKVDAPQRCQKGSVWEIELHRGRPTRATYHPPGGRTD